MRQHNRALDGIGRLHAVPDMSGLGYGPGGLTSAFDPSTAVSGCQAWWDFSDAGVLFTDLTRTTPVSSDGQRILSVTDKSGQGHHPTGDTGAGNIGAFYKTNIKNGLSVARADTVNSSSLHKTFTLNQPCTYVIVFRQNTNGGFDYLIDGWPNGSTFNTTAFVSNNSTTQWTLYAGSATDPTFNLTQNAWYIAIAIFNGASSAIYLNGGSGTTGSPGTTNPGGVNIFSRGDATNAILDGDIGDFAVYDSALGSTDRATLFTGFNTKWAVY